MSHVSVLELHQFVTRAESSREFDAHVSACASCAERLSQFARREVAPVTVMEEEPRRLAALVMAFAACFAVMLVQTIGMPKFDAPETTPEGTHGVSRSDDPRLIESEFFAARPSAIDSGAVDSGVR